jgi:hypothetical protein
MSFSSPGDLDIVVNLRRILVCGDYSAQSRFQGVKRPQVTRYRLPLITSGQQGKDGSSRRCLTIPTNFFLGHDKTSTPSMGTLANQMSSATSQFILC